MNAGVRKNFPHPARTIRKQPVFQPEMFYPVAVTKQGRSAIATTCGNSDCHVILRGGRVPNYDAASIDAAWNLMAAAGLSTCIMIDASHGNSNKRPENQVPVSESIAQQIEAADPHIGGIMLESHLLGGRQDLVAGMPLVYGQSITDGCIDWQTSVSILERLAGAVEERRARNRATLQAGGSGLNRDTSEISAAGESLRGCAGQ